MNFERTVAEMCPHPGPIGQNGDAGFLQQSLIQLPCRRAATTPTRGGKGGEAEMKGGKPNAEIGK